MIIPIGVNTDGRREVLGLEIGTSEAEPIWMEFLRKLTRRGLRGVKLVVSDAQRASKPPFPRSFPPPGKGAGFTSGATHSPMLARVVDAWSQPSLQLPFAQDTAEAGGATLPIRSGRSGEVQFTSYRLL